MFRDGESLAQKIISLEQIALANQPVIDGLATGERKISNNKNDFQSEWNKKTNELWNSKQAEIKDFQTDRHAKLSFQLKVANMTIGQHITGEGQHGYNPRQGLVPTQSWNFRDIIPTSPSPTGSYVTFRETGTSGSISAQTEGQQKSQIDYSFTEEKTVSNYISGWARISKQMMFRLPWIQNTLTRMLLRDFYKKENAYFYGVAALAATGDAVMTGTNDAEQLLSAIANQRDADFEASYILVSHSDWSHLLKTGRNDNSGYSLPGGITWDSNGNLKIAGVPILPASWVTTGEPLIFDRDFVERVETESLRVEFSYEDNDNFTKNLVTARIECFEDLNILRPDSIILAELGGS